MHRKTLPVISVLVLFFVFSAIQPAYSNSDPLSETMEPIAYIGHGAMFDRTGKEIQVTPEFLREAQNYYRDALLKKTDEKRRVLFEQKRQRLFSGQKWDSQSEHYTNVALIEWLIKETKPANADTLSGKMKLLRQKLLESALQSDPAANINDVESIELPSELKKLLIDEGLLESGGGGTVLFSTTLGGSAYINECRGAGVPIPPDWGSSSWVNKGVLTNEFISASQETVHRPLQSQIPMHRQSVVQQIPV